MERYDKFFKEEIQKSIVEEFKDYCHSSNISKPTERDVHNFMEKRRISGLSTKRRLLQSLLQI